MTPAEAVATNRRTWETWAPLHARSEFYDIDGFKRGRDTLTPIETALLPDVRGRTLVHLQCHMGFDTLSWARREAVVTGVDFSANALATARALATELNLDARFIESDIYDLPTTLPHRYDIVYCSYGAINWLPDLAAWARVAAGLLSSGGRLVVVDVHPFAWMLPFEIETPSLPLCHDYFRTAPEIEEHPGSYAAPEAPVCRTVEYPVRVADIINSVVNAGLRIEHFDEYPVLTWPGYPWMERDSEYPQHFWRMPASLPKFPLLFSLVASRA